MPQSSPRHGRFGIGFGVEEGVGEALRTHRRLACGLAGEAGELGSTARTSRGKGADGLTHPSRFARLTGWYLPASYHPTTDLPPACQPLATRSLALNSIHELKGLRAFRFRWMVPVQRRSLMSLCCARFLSNFKGWIGWASSTGNYPAAVGRE